MMNKFNGNAVLITGTILMSFGFFIVAIESVFFFLIGISLLGFAAPFAILPLFPLMRNSLKSDYRNSNEAINALSGLYNAALGIGAIAGPLIGSHLYFYFGFFTTAYVLGNFCILLSIILFCSGGCCRSSDDVIECSDLSENPGVLNSSFLEPNILPVPSGRQFNKP